MTSSISNCSISINGQHNKHSKDALVAIAKAAEANARAIERMAESVQIDFGNSCAVKIVSEDE